MATHRTTFILLAGLILVLSFLSLATESSFQRSSISEHVSTTSPTQSGDGHADQQAQSLDDVLAYAREILREMRADLHDYRGLLVKRERIGGTLGTETRMELVVRNRRHDLQTGERSGLAAYLKFLTPKMAAGREVIWVEDRNDGKLICHEGGFKNWKRLVLDPNGTLAMLGNKYPITEIGLVRLVEKLIEKGERDQPLSQAKVTIVEEQMVGDRPCRLIEVTHAEPKAGLDFHIAQIFIDSERGIPLRYAAYLWPSSDSEPPSLEEEYTYLDVEVNVGVTDAVFDADNPAYNFP